MTSNIVALEPCSCQNNVETDSRYYRQYTPLHHAAANSNWRTRGPNSAEVVRLLIDSKVDVNAKARYDETALQCSAKEDHVAVCRLLVDASVDVNAIDKYSCVTHKPFKRYKQPDLRLSLLSCPNNSLDAVQEWLDCS